MKRPLTPALLGILAGLALAFSSSAAPPPSPTDTNFVQAAVGAGMAEIEFGKLAEGKVQASSVSSFAKRMVEDHSKANEQLIAIARKEGIPVPPGMDEEHRKKLEELSHLSNGAFDRAYIQSQVADHQTAVQLFETEIGSGHVAALQNFASATLPTLFAHLKMAQEVALKLRASGS